jgi:hypothetical protein
MPLSPPTRHGRGPTGCGRRPETVGPPATLGPPNTGRVRPAVDGDPKLSDPLPLSAHPTRAGSHARDLTRGISRAGSHRLWTATQNCRTPMPLSAHPSREGAARGDERPSRAAGGVDPGRPSGAEPERRAGPERRADRRAVPGGPGSASSRPMHGLAGPRPSWAGIGRGRAERCPGQPVQARPGRTAVPAGPERGRGQEGSQSARRRREHAARRMPGRAGRTPARPWNAGQGHRTPGKAIERRARPEQPRARPEQPRARPEQPRARPENRRTSQKGPGHAGQEPPSASGSGRRKAAHRPGPQVTSARATGGHRKCPGQGLK